MIAKIVKGKAFKGCVNYILDKNKDAVLLDTQGLRLKSNGSIIQNFVSQARLNPNLAKSVGHISLSFSAQDKEMLTNDLMLKVAKEYMQKMGIKDTQYFIARHFDREHPHIHLCFNRVDNNGKTISDKNDRFRSEKICKELTEKYGLYFSTGKENVKTNRLKEPDRTKHEMYLILNFLVPKCKNWNQLLSYLNKQGIDAKFKYKGQSDEIQGITFMKNGYSFTGSKIDRMFSYSKIDFQLKQNNFSQGQLQSSRNVETQSKGIAESLIEGLSSVGGGELHGDDYEENAFKDRMEYEENKRQQKRKPRRGL